MRGPQRDATSSSSSITASLRTAEISLQPGRSATEAAVTSQHLVSARKIISGSLDTMNSALSCG
jgi:hypothetical protein